MRAAMTIPQTRAALAALALLLVLEGVAMAPSSARIKSDVLYFPDQVEYIQAAQGKCESPNQLYWPDNRRCYAEGTQGPCNFEYRLVWDERQMRPRCERDNSLFDSR